MSVPRAVLASAVSMDAWMHGCCQDACCQHGCPRESHKHFVRLGVPLPLAISPHQSLLGPLHVFQARLISALSPLDFDKDLSLHAGFQGRQWMLEELAEWMGAPVGVGEQFRWCVRACGWVCSTDPWLRFVGLG